MSTATLVKYVPVGDRIIVRRDPTPDEMSGFMLPDSAKEPPLLATVEALGPDCKQLKVGMRVVLASYAGTELGGKNGAIKEESPDLLVLREDDIICIVS